MKFWKAILAGKLAMLCLRVGALAWARRLANYETIETHRVALLELDKMSDEELEKRHLARRAMKLQDKIWRDRLFMQVQAIAPETDRKVFEENLADIAVATVWPRTRMEEELLAIYQQVVDEKAGVCGFRLLWSDDHCQNREPCSAHGDLKCWCGEKATHGCGEHSGSAGICGSSLCADHQCRWAAHSREGALQHEQWTGKP